MDVPAGNALASPYGGTSQPLYPWRGRITVHPAAGQPGTPDKTSAAATQVAAFVGTAGPDDFTVVGDEVVYAGPDEWSFRRFILHHAYLAKAAGGVDAFLLCSELRGLSWVRNSASSYPFVEALTALAEDVKTVLPEAKVVYAADWSEYFGHQPPDGSGDVHFHLDPLWASDAIDAIGIDVYWPLADWRDGRDHLDYAAGTRSIYDLAYLRGNLRAGEGFDWYYASAEDRAAQVRSSITDGSGKPWVFRYKDIKSWWLNAHHDRPGGVESGVPTSWVPQSKPFWLMEIGCPAVDKGANQPNVFVDPKSSETAVPYFSRGARDDFMQRRFLRAFVEGLDPDADNYLAGANPLSEVYAGRMIDVARIHVYCWDARPYPAFPSNTDVWGDGDNWRLGHWLTGRYANAPLAETVAQLLTDYGFAEHETGALNGTVPGYVIDRVMAARDALQPLELAYFFDPLESGGAILFRHRGVEPPVVALEESDLVETRVDSPLLSLTRGQETELPASAKVRFVSSSGDYSQAVAEARRLTGASGRVSQADLPLVLDGSQAEAIAETWLFEAWAARERASFALPPSLLALEPADMVRIDGDGDGRLFRVTEIGEHGARDIEARSVDPEIYGVGGGKERPPRIGAPVLSGQPLVEFIDLPLLRGDEPPAAGYAAATQAPWPGSVAVYGSPETTGYALKALATAPATVGVTLADLPAGPEGRLDHGTRLTVKVEGEELTSCTLVQLLAGRNVGWCAMPTASGRSCSSRRRRSSRRGRTCCRNCCAARAAANSRCGRWWRRARASFYSIRRWRASIWRRRRSGCPIRGAMGRRRATSAMPRTRSPRTRSRGSASSRCRRCMCAQFAPAATWRSRGCGARASAATVGRRRRRRSARIAKATRSILDGASVKRTLAANVPGVIYPAAQQAADFGSPQPAYDIRVYQLSAAYGRGTARSASV